MQLALVDVQLRLMARTNKGSLIKEKLIRADMSLGGCGKHQYGSQSFVLGTLSLGIPIIPHLTL